MIKRNTKKRNTKKRNTKRRLQRGGNANLVETDETDQMLLNKVYNTDNYWKEKVKQIMRKRPGSTINVAPTRFKEITDYDMPRKGIKTYEEYYHRLKKEYEEADENSGRLRAAGAAGGDVPTHP